MHSPTENGANAGDDDDSLVVEIMQLARRIAGEMFGPDTAADLAQQISLECLARLRKGTLVVDRTSLGGLVRTMVQRRKVDRARHRRARKAPEQQYELDNTSDVHPWMAPDTQLEEAELDAFYRSVLDTFKPKARLAFVMVREMELSYEDVALHLGIAKSAVHWHVTQVQRRFRFALREIGVRPPGRTRDVASRRNTAQQGEQEFRIVCGGGSRSDAALMTRKQGAA